MDNLEETLHNLRFAPSPMLSTIYSVPSTPRDELSTPDFTASTTSCFTPPSTNPTPEPHLTPRGVVAPALPPPPPSQPVTSPTRPRSNSRRTSPPTRKRGRGVVSCINTPTTFPTTWYAHPTAPDFNICARCYEDHLAGTRLENDFRGRLLDDGKPRACHFASSPRVVEHLLPRALSEGRTDDLVAFLRRRGDIPDCRGQAGVPGREAQRWFRPRNNAVPNMVVCEACFEDHVLPSPSAAANFEPASQQPASDVWACDLALPSIRRAYKLKAPSSWPSFCAAAAERMSLPACARSQKVAVKSRMWFAPTTSGMQSALVCAACFADHVAGTGEERRWRELPADAAARFGSMTRCALGRFDLGVAMSRAHEAKDFGVFWRALDAVCHEEPCEKAGIRDGRWFTFPSHPEGFAVCAGCVASVVEPLGLAASLVPRCSSSSGAPTVCSLNPASPRFAAYAARLLEGFYVADAGALEAYALEFASLPPCPRDEDFRGGRWYGWQGCAVCPSCYHEFARGTALAAGMTLRGEVVKDASLMCEMYSPRMRGLYTEACARGDVKGLLAAAAARRKVFAETVPVIRETVLEAQMRRGGAAAVDGPGVGLGIGFANLLEVQPGQGGSVASVLGSGTTSLVVAELERRWREVE